MMEGDVPTSFVYGILLQLFHLITKSYPADRIQQIKNIAKLYQDTWPSFILKYGLRFSYPDRDQEGFGEIKLIANPVMDETKEPNVQNFNSIRNGVNLVCSEFGTTTANDKDFMHGCSSFNALTKKEVEVPLWFMIHTKHYVEEVLARPVGYFQDWYEVCGVLREMPFVGLETTEKQLHISLGQDLNKTIQILAKERKIKGIRTHINGLDIAISKLQTDSSLENSGKLGKLIEEKQYLLTKMQTLLRTKVIPAMNSPNETEIISMQAQNTIIEVPVEPTVGTIVPFGADGNLADITMSDQVREFDAYADRWVHFKTISIDATTKAGDLIDQIHLPYDALESKWDTPLATPFRNHSFWRGPIQIKAVWNINKFNQCAVQMGYVYHLLQRDRQFDLQNIHSVSQQPGAILNGHMTSSVEIDIPYNSYLNTIPVRKTNDAMNLYIATLNISALTPYQASSGSPDSAQLNLYIRMPKLRFYGLIEQENAFPANSDVEFYRRYKSTKAVQDEKERRKKMLYPCMMAGVKAGLGLSFGKQLGSNLANTIGSTLDSVLSVITPNRSRGGNYAKKEHRENNALYQRTTTNMAGGRCEFVGESMRLWSESEVPQNNEFFCEDTACDFASINSTFGFVTSFTVSRSNLEGDKVFSAKIQPGLTQQFISGSNFGNSVQNFAPCDHIASFFQNYSGHIEYKFIPVVDGAKTFRLRFAFNPNSNRMTYDESDSMYLSIMETPASLDASLEHVYQVPYINTMCSYPYNDEFGEQTSKGSIHVFVETPISAPENVYDNFEVLVYKRMTMTSHSMAIPVPSRTCIPTRPRLQLLISIDADNNARVRFGNSDVSSIIPNPGSLNIRIEGLTSMRTADGAFTWDDSLNPLVINILNSSFRQVSIGAFKQGFFGVGFNTSVALPFDVEGSPSLIVLPSVKFHYESDKKLILTWKGKKHSYIVDRHINHVETLIQKINLFLVDVETGETTTTATTRLEPAMNGSREERFTNKNLVSFTQQAQQCDTLLFGEHHLDMVDNLRRQERFALSPRISMMATAEPTRCYQIPCNFGASSWRNDLPSDFANSKILAMHDCMRYTRGGLNYIINITPRIPNGVIRLVHVPQCEDLPFALEEKLDSKIYDYAGYAETVMALNQNTVIPITIPMYAGGNGLLNATYYSTERLANACKSLGKLEMYYSGPENDLNIEVNRAFSNETNMFCFNGFPQRESTQFTVSNNAARLKLFPAMLGEMSTVITGLAQVDYSEVNRTLNSINKVASTVDNSLTATQDFIERLKGVVSNGDIIATIVLQVSQVFNNPTITTAILATSQVCVSMGFLNQIPMEKIQNMLKGVFYTSPCMGDFVTEASEFSSTIISAVVAYLGAPSSFGFSDKLSFAFVKSATLYQKMLVIIETVLKFVKKFVIWLMEYLCPESKILEWMKEDKLQNWLNATAYFIDETVFHILKTDKDAVVVLYHYINIGQNLEYSLNQSSRTSRIATTIAFRVRELTKVRNKLVPFITAPLAKFNPFCLYMSGDSHIGKSHMCQVLSKELEDVLPPLQTVRAKTNKPFVVPSNKYWDNYDGNSIVVFDDFMRNTQPDTVSESDCARLCDIKGPAEMVAPKADIESKGMQVTSTLVLCASNHLFPTCNGYNKKVVWNRRDSTWNVRISDEFKEGCEYHKSKVDLKCSRCRTPKLEESLKQFKHLKFTQVLAQAPYKAITEHTDVDYSTFLQIVRTEMVQYYREEMMLYEQRLCDILKCSKEAIYEMIAPKGPYVNVNKTVTSEIEKGVISRLGGPANIYVSKPEVVPCMIGEAVYRLAKKMSIVDNRDDAPRFNTIHYDSNGEAYKGCLHELFIQRYIVNLQATIEYEESDAFMKTLSNIEYHPGFIKIRDAYLNRVYDISTTQPCNFDCVWTCTPDLQLIGTMHELVVQGCLKFGEKLPEWFPKAHMPNDYKIEINSLRDLYHKNKFMHQLKDILLKVGCIITPIALIGSFIAIYEMRKTKAKDLETPQVTNKVPMLLPATYQENASVDSKGAGGPSQRKYKNRQRAIIKRSKTNKKPAMVDESIQRVYKQNSMHIVFDGCVKARAVAIAQNVFLTQAHAMNDLLVSWADKIVEKRAMNINENDIDALVQANFMFETAKGQHIGFNMSLKTFLKMNNNFILFCGESDICIFTFKHAGFVCKGLNMHIYSEKDTISNQFGVLRYRRNAHGVVQWDSYDVATDCQERFEEISYDLDHCKWASRLGLVTGDEVNYSFDGFICKNIYGTEALNMCGSLLTDLTTGKIIGVMSAADSNYLYFNALSIESLQHYDVCFNTGHVLVEQAISNNERKIVMPANVFDVLPPVRIYHTTKNSIVKSPLFGQVSEVTKFPSNIEVDKDRGVGSYERAIQQYIPHKPFDFNLQQVFDDVKYMYLPQVSSMPFKSKRTTAEAIAGVDEFVARIKMSTSPGFPWTTIGLGNKKQLIIYDENDKLVGVHELLRDQLNLEMEMMEKEIPVPTIFQVSHKDELLVDPNKVRIIQGSPLTYSIHMRQYYMDFNYMFQECRDNLEHAVGLNILSQEWDRLARRLLAKGSKILVGDFSKFGPRLYNLFIEQSYKIMNEWYAINQSDPSDQHIRTQLAKRVLNSKNIAYNKVTQVNCGSPSGAINTVIINTMCNQMYMRTAWVGIMSELKPEYAPIHYFKEFVEAVFLGDDVIMSVSDEVCEYFNNTTLQEFFAKYDIKYTDVVDKSTGEIRKWCSIHEATFLKQGFRKYDDTSIPGGVWVIKPNYHELDNILNYVRKLKGVSSEKAKNKEHWEALSINASTLARYKWFDGRESFDKYQSLMAQKFRNSGVPYKIYTFDSLQLDYGYPLKNDYSGLDAATARTQAQRRLCEDSGEYDLFLDALQSASLKNNDNSSLSFRKSSGAGSSPAEYSP